MRLGAPEPLQDFSWMLHTWRLTHIQAKQHAKLVPQNITKQFPVVVFSHGLGGNMDIYSYQTLSLAAKGSIVILLNHLDGTGPVVKTKCGHEVLFDKTIAQLDWKIGDVIRRNQTNLRATEVLVATDAVLDMNQEDTDEIRQAGISFRDRLAVNHVTAMGHSFGGAAAFTAAQRRPQLYQAVIAHEPATAWMPDLTRKAFFAKSRLEGVELIGDMGSGFLDKIDDVYDNNITRTHENDNSLAAASDMVDHELFPNLDTLVLFSHEWRENGGASVICSNSCTKMDDSAH